MNQTHDDGHDATNGTPGSGAGPADGVSGEANRGSADETFGWTAPEAESAASGGETRATAEKMLGQLQSMIDAIATQAAPVVRQVGAKAAELAAVAADRAGPLAHKAADATADAGGRLAERSRTWAADLRNRTADAVGGRDDDAAAGAAAAGTEGSGVSGDVPPRDDPTGSART